MKMVTKNISTYLKMVKLYRPHFLITVQKKKIQANYRLVKKLKIKTLGVGREI